MVNHLRIALKHLFDEQNMAHKIESGNYRVNRNDSEGNSIVAIDHLMFHGENEFRSCQWNLQKKTVYICEGENCPVSEIIFIIRTVKTLGYMIDHVVFGSAEDDIQVRDRSSVFEKYLAN